MSRNLEILRKARLEANLFSAQRPSQLVRPTAGWMSSHDQWQQLVHELYLRREMQESCAIGFASATAGEGASYVAQHVAAGLARLREQPSLLLEANVYRPSQHERHGVEPDPGLRRILKDRGLPIDRCLRQTAIERLWLLPAGSVPNGSVEPPDWTYFPQLTQRLRGRFPGIVVDLPPVNLSTDAMMITPLLDGVVLVVEAGLCSREVIQNVTNRLRRASPNVLGTVLNKRKFVIPEAIYRRL